MAVAVKKKAPAKKVQMADVNVIAILDMSGSMSGKEHETRGGFNSFVQQAQKDQAKEGGKVTVSLTCFDTRFMTVFDRTPVQDVKVIGPAEYTPAGSTALYDAIGKTLAPLSFPKGEKVMVIITTDGHENASVEWTAAKAKSLIERKEAEGWEFMFLGVGLNAFDASNAIATAAMTHNTVSTPNTAASAGATQSAATSSGYRSLRRGSTVHNAVAAAYAGVPGSADYEPDFASLIDRTVADPLGRTAATPLPAQPSETTTAKLRKLRSK